jgi:hypothetical protein
MSQRSNDIGILCYRRRATMIYNYDRHYLQYITRPFKPLHTPAKHCTYVCAHIYSIYRDSNTHRYRKEEKRRRKGVGKTDLQALLLFCMIRTNLSVETPFVKGTGTDNTLSRVLSSADNSLRAAKRSSLEIMPTTC